MSVGGCSGLKGFFCSTGGGRPDRPEGSITGGRPTCAWPSSGSDKLQARSIHKKKNTPCPEPRHHVSVTFEWNRAMGCCSVA